MRCFFALIAIFYIVQLPAQLMEDFSDGNFSSTPIWLGDTALFVVNQSGMLQLNAPAAGRASILTNVLFADSIRWKTRLKLDFAPSTTNQLRIWLQADSVSNFHNGYFLEIGENGNQDGLSLFSRQNGQDALLTSGMHGTFGLEPVDGILTARSSVSGWWIFEFTSVDGVYTVFDAYLPEVHLEPIAWTGFECFFTATRKDKFFFDDVEVGANVPDLSPPVLSKVSAKQHDLLEIEFDEELDSTLTAVHFEYFLNEIKGQGGLEFHGNKLLVHLSSSLMDNEWYTFSTSGATDRFGNSAGVETVEFFVWIGKPVPTGGIVWSEVMADPSPSVGLPETIEWLEIYNRSDVFVQLKGMKIREASGAFSIIPEEVIAPGQYLVLCSSYHVTALQTAENKVLGLENFPGLTNAGEYVELVNASDQIVDQLQYSDLWHQDPQKRQGGWSLERGNLQLDCLGAQNWQSCRTLPGGTPGLPNSFQLDSLPPSEPTLVQLSLPDPSTLDLYFSNSIALDQLENSSLFNILPTLLIEKVSWSVEQPRRLRLHLLEEMQAGLLYQLTIQPGWKSCEGYQVQQTLSSTFGLPLQAKRGDLALNELLFDPFPGGSRFVEIVNVSPNVISTNQLYLANFEQGPALFPLPPNRFLLPNDHLVVSSDIEDVKSRYPNCNHSWLLQMPLPTMSETTGNCSLLYSSTNGIEIIDSFSYSSNWHNPLLGAGQREGISLERIRLDQVASSASNWTSGAGYGSPTQPNTQRRAWLDQDGYGFEAASNRLSPDGDGWEDFWEISYSLPENGFWMNAIIYNLEGIPMKSWMRQELLSTSGTLRWDGDTDTAEVATPGIYVAWMECFHPSGTVFRKKEVVAVVQKQ